MFGTPLNRRKWLQQSACGFGSLAASAMLNDQAVFASNQVLHHRAHAKRIIFLFMQGGVSQVDSFDYKPILAKRHGDKLPFDDARQLAKTGKRTEHHLMQSPWQFRQYGSCGQWVSDLFPETAQHVDDLCMIHGMHTEGVAHGPATLFLHCGATNFIRPSMGSWVYYGLGAENENLPGFVSIAPSIGNGGPRNYGSAFLPPQFQGTRVGSLTAPQLSIDNLGRSDLPRQTQMQQVDFVNRLNRQQLDRRAISDEELEATIASHELAWRMQQFAPEVLDLERESAHTLQAYGIDDPKTRAYGQRCLLARRLCEAGVRFIQVTHGDNSANPAWDQHSNIPKHADHAAAVDKPIAALLSDLKQRGLLDETIVWWGSEFGRTPYSQENGTGRDHNPRGFTVWLAGGGFKSGFRHGETDEFGFQSINGRVHMHDLHATLLHQLGLDHKRLVFEHAGRQFRLTDIHGQVIHDVVS
ncbi:MAG: DUF1501 domain-containing protein [Planctomycetales bacterium]|nr:DUF1501 domain-containing protein [Planctomycetales bacterium]